jgi:hypothetical protein
MWFPSGAFCLLLATSSVAQGGNDSPRVLAFASENWLTLAIGEYKPHKGWVQATEFYAPPEPQNKVTLFGTSGRLGEVQVIDERAPSPNGTFADWSARIERGPTIREPFALAIMGTWPDSGADSTELALDDPANEQIVSVYLKNRGLHVETPVLTQAYRVDVEGNGQPATLICAHSDIQAMTDDQEASVYAVALLRVGPPGKEKTFALASQTSFKPASRTIEEHERLYGKRDFLRFIAFHDIVGDSHKEIILYRSKDGATEVDVFTFDGRRLRQVLSAEKPHYN